MKSFYDAFDLALNGREQEALAVCAQHKTDVRFDLLATEILYKAPPYLRILANEHARREPRTYVEIGVGGGESLGLAQHSQRVVGVDPKPLCTLRSNNPGHQIHNLTSDEFFARELCPVPVDMAFVDGLHHWDQTQLDFLNLEKRMAPGGVIYVHDVLAIYPEVATREQHTVVWTGDVWRFLLWITEQRKDLRMTLYRSPPSGLLKVTGFNPKWTGDLMRAEYNARPWEDRIQ